MTLFGAGVTGPAKRVRRVVFGWQAEMLVVAALNEVSGEVVFMDALSDYNDRAGALVVQPSRDCAVVPIDHGLSCTSRVRVFEAVGVIDDDVVAALAGRRPSYAGREADAGSRVLEAGLLVLIGE